MDGKNIVFYYEQRGENKKTTTDEIKKHTGQIYESMANIRSESGKRHDNQNDALKKEIGDRFEPSLIIGIPIDSVLSSLSLVLVNILLNAK